MILSKKQLQELKDNVIHLRAILSADAIKEVRRCADVYENAYKEYYEHLESPNTGNVDYKIVNTAF